MSDNRAIDRLTELLDAKDAALAAATEELVKLRKQVAEKKAAKKAARNAPVVWPPNQIDDAHPELPLPRLELVYTRPDPTSWSQYKVTYRLVRRHFGGKLVAEVFEETDASGNRGFSDVPWKNPSGSLSLPIRSGIHICHDSAHLRLPAYVIHETGTAYINAKAYASFQTEKGEDARKA